LTIAELKTRLRNLGLKVTSDKAALRKETLKRNNCDRETEDEEDGSDVEKEGAEVQPARHHTNSVRRRNGSSPESPYYRQPMFTFKDVEDALETFSGDSGENVKR